MDPTHSEDRPDPPPNDRSQPKRRQIDHSDPAVYAACGGGDMSVDVGGDASSRKIAVTNLLVDDAMQHHAFPGLPVTVQVLMPHPKAKAPAPPRKNASKTKSDKQIDAARNMNDGKDAWANAERDLKKMWPREYDFPWTGHRAWNAARSTAHVVLMCLHLLPFTDGTVEFVTEGDKQDGNHGFMGVKFLRMTSQQFEKMNKTIISFTCQGLSSKEVSRRFNVWRLCGFQRVIKCINGRIVDDFDEVVMRYEQEVREAWLDEMFNRKKGNIDKVRERVDHKRKYKNYPSDYPTAVVLPAEHRRPIPAFETYFPGMVDSSHSQSLPVEYKKRTVCARDVGSIRIEDMDGAAAAPPRSFMAPSAPSVVAPVVIAALDASVIEELEKLAAFEKQLASDTQQRPNRGSTLMRMYLPKILSDFKALTNTELVFPWGDKDMPPRQHQVAWAWLRFLEARRCIIIKYVPYTTPVFYEGKLFTLADESCGFFGIKSVTIKGDAYISLIQESVFAFPFKVEITGHNYGEQLIDARKRMWVPTGLCKFAAEGATDNVIITYDHSRRIRALTRYYGNIASSNRFNDKKRIERIAKDALVHLADKDDEADADAEPCSSTSLYAAGGVP